MVGSIGTICIGMFGLFLLLKLPAQSSYARSVISVEKAGVGLPVRLKIPKIKVDAAVEYVGLTPQRAMDAPRAPGNVGWFDLGVRPGEDGSAVIAGHYGWKNGKAAAFDGLNKLRKGDKIYIVDSRGITLAFVVREVRMYDQKANAPEVFDSADGKAHLNLITCEGSWNRFQKSYSSRRVVFTDKE